MEKRKNNGLYQQKKLIETRLSMKHNQYWKR